MKIALIACSLFLAAAAFAQSPSPSPETVASPAESIAPAVATSPVATTPLPTASVNPSVAIVPTATPSPSEDPDDEIDNMIEKKVRKHFNFSFDGDKSHESDVPWIAIPIVFIVFLAIFGTPVMIVATIMYFGFSRNRALHKTVRMMVEKGQPVPEALLNPPPVVRQRSDLRRGIVLLMVGLGAMVFFGAMNDWEGGAWSLGIIPFLIGAGYLLVWKLDVRREEASPRV